MGKDKFPVRTPEEYIERLEPSFRKTLEDLRSVIRKHAPEAEEMISYQIVCFRHRYMLVGISANRDYCSLHTMDPELVKKMKGELKEVKVSGATLHFVPGESLPDQLIKSIVEQRLSTNERKASKKRVKS